jgi:hypothetical protein
MVTSQAFRTLFTGDGACALGAALLAVGAPAGQAVRAALARWPWALALSVSCPSCGRSRLVCEVIVHLNDEHRWTREAIGTWIAEIEPADDGGPLAAPGARRPGVGAGRQSPWPD